MLTSRQRFVILGLITFVLALSTGDRATLSVAGPHMSKALGITPIQMGWLFSAFAWAYVLAHVPAGWIVDKLGAKRSMLIGLLLWSLANPRDGRRGVVCQRLRDPAGVALSPWLFRVAGWTRVGPDHRGMVSIVGARRGRRDLQQRAIHLASDL